MKRLFALLLCAVLIFALAVSAGAVDYGCDIDTTTNAVYLENLDSGIVVFEKNADERVYPASTTKEMTYIVVTENIPDLENTRVEITSSALATLDPESSIMGLESHIGESFSVKDLLYGLMVPSGNDAALVLADYVGKGSIDNFVDLMNQKAAQLGCESTHFANPHGFTDENHYTTARDMAKITKHAMQMPLFTEITNTKRYLPEGFSEELETTNYLIDYTQKGGYYFYQFAKGIKTGYTDEAGRCLISTAEKGDYTYLCVALGADYSFVEDINYAMLDTADLYEWAFNNLSNQVVFSSAEPIKSVPVVYVWGNKSVNLVPEKEITALLPIGYDESHVSTSIECEDKAVAPVSKGDVFGTFTVYYDGEVIGTTNIVAAEDVPRDTLNFILHRVLAVVRDYFVFFLIGLVLIIVLIVAISVSRRRKRIERSRRRYR